MKTKIIKLINRYDIIFIVIVFISSIGLWFTFDSFFKITGDVEAVVYYKNAEVKRLKLDEDQTFLLPQSKYPDLLADLEVEVKGNAIRISKETSPNNICSKQGWTNSSLKTLACLPNHVFVVIEAPNTDDVDTTIK